MHIYKQLWHWLTSLEMKTGYHFCIASQITMYIYKEFTHSQLQVNWTQYNNVWYNLVLIEHLYNQECKKKQKTAKMKNDSLFLFKKILSAFFALFTKHVLLLLKIQTKSIDKNETLKGNYISWQYKYSGMNKVFQISFLGRALLKTVKIWPMSKSPISVIQNQISFFF